MTTVLRTLCRLALLALITQVTTAPAQTSSAFVGTWKVTWQGPRQALQARLVITPTGGTWKALSSRPDNPCSGREVPISVEETEAGSAKVILRFAESLSGCNDVELRLRRVDERTLTGTRGQAELALVREQ